MLPPSSLMWVPTNMIPGKPWAEGKGAEGLGKKIKLRLCFNPQALPSLIAVPRSGSQLGQTVFCGRSRLQVEVPALQDERVTGSR